MLLRTATFLLVAMISAFPLSAATSDHPPSEILGTWRGTSLCVDLVAAPACHDEVVVYDFTAGEKPGVVRWKADKVVKGERQPMAEMEMSWSSDERCWLAEFSARIHSLWCLAVDGRHMTGTARLLPGKQVVRKIDVRKD